MKATPFIDRILEDEGLVADLDEADAQALLAALLDRARGMKNAAEVERLIARGRQVGRSLAQLPKPVDRNQLIRRLLDEQAD